MYCADHRPQLTFLEHFLVQEMALSPILAYWDERLDNPAVLAPLRRALFPDPRATHDPARGAGARDAGRLRALHGL